MTRSDSAQPGIGGIIGRALRIGFIPTAIGIMLLVLILRDNGTDDRLVKREIYAMGTLITISAVADPANRTGAEAAVSAAARTAQAVQTRWQPQPGANGGALAMLNAALADAQHANVPGALQPLFDQAIDITRASQGRFDPGVGALVQLWGFDDPDNFRDRPLPDATILAALQRPHSLRDVRITGENLTVSGTGLMLDFGAMAKGHAVNAMIETLRESGINNALVNAGGDLKAIGTSPRGRVGNGLPWTIAIRHPRPTPSDSLLALLELRSGEAVFTSGDYERYFEFEGQRYHHLIDPRTGRPAQGVQSATVVATDAALADAAATALFVGGRDAFATLTAALGLDQAMLVDAAGQIVCTPALCDRLQWTSPLSAPPTQISPTGS